MQEVKRRVDKNYLPDTDGLSRPERQKRLVEAAQRGSSRAADLAVVEVEGLIWQIVRKWAWGSHCRGQYLSLEDQEDMRAEARMVVFEKAIPKFDGKKSGWTTYAGFWIRNAASRWHADHSRTIRLPVWMQDKSGHGKALEGKSGVERLVIESGARMLSLDHTLPSFAGDEENLRTFLDVLVDDRPSVEDVLVEGEAERAVELHRAMKKLDTRSRSVIRLRMKGFTLAEVGMKVGGTGDKKSISRERVRQIEVAAKEVIRCELGAVTSPSPVVQSLRT